MQEPEIKDGNHMNFGIQSQTSNIFNKTLEDSFFTELQKLIDDVNIVKGKEKKYRLTNDYKMLKTDECINLLKQLELQFRDFFNNQVPFQKAIDIEPNKYLVKEMEVLFMAEQLKLQTLKRNSSSTDFRDNIKHWFSSIHSFDEAIRQRLRTIHENYILQQHGYADLLEYRNSRKIQKEQIKQNYQKLFPQSPRPRQLFKVTSQGKKSPLKQDFFQKLQNKHKKDTKKPKIQIQDSQYYQGLNMRQRIRLEGRNKQEGSRSGSRDSRGSRKDMFGHKQRKKKKHLM